MTFFLCVLGGLTVHGEPPLYPDKAHLLVVRDADGKERSVRTAADWAKRRAHILANMQRVMGPLPDDSRKVPLDVKISETVELPRYVRKKLTFAVEKDDRVPAYLLVPRGRKGKLPGMLVLHQTIKIGKDEPAGLGEQENKRIGVHLAERGYVVLCPDYPSFGEYRYDFAKSKFASGSMKAIWNNMRAVDLLASLQEVDAARIGCIGHSLGGHNTMFTAVFDTRIKACVSNCGFTSFPKYYGGKLKGWTSARYMPRIARQFDLKPEKVPFDFPEVVAALAPRAFLASSPLHDDNFEMSGVKDCIAAAKPVYDLLGAKEKLAANYPDCQHDFPPEVRQVAYSWLDRWLQNDKSSSRKTLIVRDTAGIRRFGCLASVEIPLGRWLFDDDHFRLLADGRPMTAQFRPVRGEKGMSSAVFCDFIASPGPLEKRTYTVEYGPEVKPGPEPKSGLKIRKNMETIAVVHPGGLTFSMPNSLLGLLHQVRTKDTEYLKSGSAGLLLRAKDGGERRLGETPATVQVTRDGPIAIGLRFENREKLPNGRQVSSVVDMEFPVTKSWVRITWTVADAQNDVAGMAAELRLNVPDAPVLVDFGAGSYVYAALEKGQTAKLRAGRLDATKTNRPAWETLLGPTGALRPYVVALPKETRAAEGWAHVMDRKRCTAVAVEGFAEAGQEAELTVAADGRLRIGRTFAASSKPKRLSFWLHFVDVPVQVGAATSPQSMLAPLRVEVQRSSEP